MCRIIAKCILCDALQTTCFLGLPRGCFENTSSENFRKVFRETSVQYIFDGKVAGIRLVTLQKNNYAF